MLNENMYQFLVASANYNQKMSTANTMTTTTTNSTLLSVIRNGALGVVVYFVGKTIYVANAGDVLAVTSHHQGAASSLYQKHEPFNCGKTAQILDTHSQGNGVAKQPCQSGM
jgi:adenylate cyclase